MRVLGGVVDFLGNEARETMSNSIEFRNSDGSVWCVSSRCAPIHSPRDDLDSDRRAPLMKHLQLIDYVLTSRGPRRLDRESGSFAPERRQQRLLTLVTRMRT